MLKRSFMAAALAGVFLVGTVACNNLPGTPGQQGAAMGGLGGAAVGAAVGGGHHRLLGALLGGALGAGGGYLIGANKDRITGHDTAAAQEAMQRAQSNPATPDMARNASTADINGDGFVTMDEIIAMRQAGLTDQQMIDRLRATGQVFELTPDQQNYLRSRGVDDYVINQLPEINREVRDRLLSQYPSGAAPTSVPPGTAPVVSRPPGNP